MHKANIMKFTDGLFLREAQAVAERYPDIAFNDRIVDNMCMQLMQKPQEYDVLVMPNLYGDIISDLVAGMVGGLGVAPSGNIGPDSAVFEADPRQRPEPRRQERSQPDGDDPLRGADAASPRRARGGGARRRRGGGRDRRRARTSRTTCARTATRARRPPRPA